MKNFVLVVSLVTISCFMFVACGKMSDPVPVEGSGYPHSYPRR